MRTWRPTFNERDRATALANGVSDDESVSSKHLRKDSLKLQLQNDLVASLYKRQRCTKLADAMEHLENKKRLQRLNLSILNII